MKNHLRITPWHVMAFAMIVLIILWWWFQKEIGLIDRQIEFLHSY